MDLILYVHGKGGSAAESRHYEPLFPEGDVVGLDYQKETPWEAGEEIRKAVDGYKSRYEHVILIANSIGAFFSMHAGIADAIERAYFISPIVDMEQLIADMMRWANVTEDMLRTQGVIHTGFGEDLSWEYLSYVRTHPVKWDVPTCILYGSRDHLTAYRTMRAFAQRHGADLTVMENGEHWFHTEEQMDVLDRWLKQKL